MRHFLPYLSCLLCSLFFTLSCQAPTPLSDQLDPNAVLQAMERVANWQLKHPADLPSTHWSQSAFYTGIMALSEISERDKYLKAMQKMARLNQYQPGPNRRFADDQAVIKTYAQLYRREPDPVILAPSIELFDFLVTLPFDEPLTWDNQIHNREWAWCDALFMAPPALAWVGQAIRKPEYLELMDRLWWKTTDYLYDVEENLYFRDSRFFEQREPNGHKVFWSRGNGWVLAGLVQVLKSLPSDFPSRVRYEALYQEMAAKIAKLQGNDGYWRSSLLDPDHFPNPETSGTGFFVYALSWGINHELLDPTIFLPVVAKGWSALIQATNSQGRLEYVQPMGIQPGKATAETTEPFGIGAFLLAGHEIFTLSQRQYR